MGNLRDDLIAYNEAINKLKSLYLNEAQARGGAVFTDGYDFVIVNEKPFFGDDKTINKIDCLTANVWAENRGALDTVAYIDDLVTKVFKNARRQGGFKTIKDFKTIYNKIKKMI